MTKYVLAYHGTGDMPEAPEDMEKVMAEWGAWFGGMGDALVDGGNPFAERRLVSADGSTGPAPGDLSGYSIIQADTFDRAVEIAKGCPVLQSDGQVEVCEAIDM